MSGINQVTRSWANLGDTTAAIHCKVGAGQELGLNCIGGAFVRDNMTVNGDLTVAGKFTSAQNDALSKRIGDLERKVRDLEAKVY